MLVAAVAQVGHYSRMAVGRQLDEDEQRFWLDWLAERTEDDGIAGFDASGWPASTWVLHAITEDLASASEATWDDIRRERLAAGLEAPLIVGSVNLDEQSTVVGGSLGMSERSPGQRVRLRWHELAARLNLDLEVSNRPPSSNWFPYRSWPARIDPPDEGSLDAESLVVLVEVLADASDGSTSPCIAYYSPLANGARFDETWMREVDVTDVPSLVDRSAGRVGTPSNWWPLDASWMVFTDWDLWATKVSGSDALIAAIERDQRLECIRWTTSATS